MADEYNLLANHERCGIIRLSLQDQYIYHRKIDKVKRIEDPMNDYVAAILNVSYITKKQSRGGRSAGGQDSGSRDIVIGK